MPDRSTARAFSGREPSGRGRSSTCATSARTPPPPLAGADIEDGLAHRDAVVAEIEQLGFLTAEVRSALVDCARHCTPDLALRVLLRVLRNAPGAALPEDLYRRLEDIGSALHYGEFVVTGVEYLVADDEEYAVGEEPA